MFSNRLLAIGLGLSVTSAFALTEDWSTPGDTRGWTVFGDGSSESVLHDGVGALSLGGSGFSEFYVFAGEGYGGSYTGFASIRFDLALETSSSIDAMALRLADLTSGHEWVYSLTPMTGGASFTYQVPLAPSGDGWTQNAGPTADFGDLLGSVEQFSLNFSKIAADGTLQATLDNVTLVAIPEPGSAASLAAASVAVFAFATRRRRR